MCPSAILPFVQIFGVPVHTTTNAAAMSLCRIWLRDTQPRHIVTANPEILLRARRDLWYRSLIDRADLVTADGIGVRWASAFLRTVDARCVTRSCIVFWFIRTLAAFFRKPQGIPSPIPERISGSDLIWDISREAAAIGASVYLLGGQRGTASRAAARLRAAFGNLRVAAYAADHLATPYPLSAVTAAIARAAPAVLFVGYGAPQQEEWIHQNLHRFPSVHIAMGVGGALDFLAGNAPRAPSQYQARGLEWFWRFAHQPSRFLRTLRATLVFPAILLASSLSHH